MQRHGHAGWRELTRRSALTSPLCFFTDLSGSFSWKGPFGPACSLFGARFCIFTHVFLPGTLSTASYTFMVAY